MHDVIRNQSTSFDQLQMYHVDDGALHICALWIYVRKEAHRCENTVGDVGHFLHCCAFQQPSVTLSRTCFASKPYRDRVDKLPIDAYGCKVVSCCLSAPPKLSARTFEKRRTCQINQYIGVGIADVSKYLEASTLRGIDI